MQSADKEKSGARRKKLPPDLPPKLSGHIRAVDAKGRKDKQRRTTRYDGKPRD
jgi:hypothetical protein